MELTIGFVSLFLVLIVPGMIFRRCYFLSEFSKQISIGEPVLNTMAYAIIPGALIQVVGVYCYSTWRSPVSSERISGIYDFLAGNQGINKFSDAFLKEDIYFYLILVYLVSGLLGFMFYLSVRFLKLDRKIKLLRFKNQWAYVFSSEILEFPKLRKLHPQSIQVATKGKYLFPNVDVLTRTGNDTTLYSGILKDYDIDRRDINKLSRVYLFEANRYKRGEDGVMERKPIPGDYLIINGDEIINLNIRYIYQKYQSKASEEAGIFSHWSIIAYQLLVVFILSSLMIYILIDLNLTQNLLVKNIVNLSLWKRLFLCMILAQSFGNVFPFELIEKDPKKYKWIGPRIFIYRFIVLVVFVLIGLIIIKI